MAHALDTQVKDLKNMAMAKALDTHFKDLKINVSLLE